MPLTTPVAEWRLGRAVVLLAVLSSCSAGTGMGRLRAVASPRVAAEELDVLGRVISSSTGEFIACDTPIVVMAKPLSDPPPAAPGRSELRRRDGAFWPSFQIALVAQEVSFKNDEEICHEFFSSSKDNAFELGLLRPGTSATIRFDRPGPVQVYCALHDGKQATILVAPTPHYALVGPRGGFVLKGLAPGRYVVEVWSEGLSPVSHEVTVSRDGAPFVEIALDQSPPSAE